MTTPGPTTYAALFGDPSNDPCGADPVAGYTEIYQRWRVEDNPPSAEDLFTDVMTDFDSPIGAVGFFVEDNHSESGVLKVTHGFRRFAGLPGRATPNRGKAFGYVGDVVDGTDIATFELNPAQFRIVTETRCANTPERQMEIFTAEPDQDVIEPLDATTQAQSMIKTRKSMFIPFCLVEYVLDKDLSAREAFEVLWPVIVQMNLREVVKPLVKFLMAAATKHSTRSPPRTVNAELGHGIVGAADVVSDRRKRVLYEQLPALQSSGTASNEVPRMEELVSQLAQLNNNARLDRAVRQQATADATKPKTVREKFGDYQADKLLKLTDSATDEDLPQIYHELAARSKGINKRSLLQQCLDMTALAMGRNKPLATSSLVIDLDNWDYVGTSHDALGTGLLPFSITPPDAPSRNGRKALLEDQERARLYDISGEAINGAISSSDAKKLYNGKGFIPSEWPEATLQIEGYAVLLGTLLGTQHRAFLEYQAALKLYERIQTRLHAALNRKLGAKLAPAMLVLYFQLNMRAWLEERWTYDMVDEEAPDLVNGLRNYMRSNRFDWLPSHEDIPALATLEGTTNPVAPATAAPGGGSRTRTPDAAGAIQVRVQNANRDPRFMGNTPLAVNIRTRSIRNAIAVAQRDPPQVTRSGRAMPTCLSWHVKGSCSEDCTRRADHVANSDQEREPLYTWCQLAFA